MKEIIRKFFAQNFLIQVVFLFVFISLFVGFIGYLPQIELGNENFWGNHGLFFLIFIALFPRLTLLLSSVASGGLLWWLGWLFTPRFLVAVLATIAYWQHNPILVMISWFVALLGESTEKYYISTGPRNRNFHFRYQTNGQQTSSPRVDGNTIEADFRRMN